MNTTHLKRSCILTLLLLTASCQTMPGNNQKQAGQSSVSSIRAGLHCGREQATPAATWIDKPQQLETSFKKIQGAILGAKPPEIPKVDFRNEIALLIEMGQHPTLGYSLALPETASLDIRKDQAYLTLRWTSPQPDVSLAQTTSSPCLLLRLKRGEYTSIRILDEEGNTQAISRMGQ